MDPSGKYTVDPPTYEEAMANPPDEVTQEEVTEKEVKKEEKKVVRSQPTNWTSNAVINSQPPAVQTYTAVDGGAGTTHVDDTCTLCCCFSFGNPSSSDCDCCCDSNTDCKCCCCSCDDCCGDCDCDCDCGNCDCDCDCGNCDCDLGGCIF